MLYAENRAWMLGTTFDIVESTSKPTTIPWKGVLGNTALTLAFRVESDCMVESREPVPTCVRLIPTAATASSVGQLLRCSTEWRLIDFRVTFHKEGFLNTIFIFRVPARSEASRLESVAEKICDATDISQTMIAQLFETLRAKKIVSCQGTATLGVPDFLLGIQGFSPSYTYYYSAHYFLKKEQDKAGKDIISALALSDTPLRLDGVRVFPGDSAYLWHPEHKWTISRICAATELQLLTLAESTAYGIGAYLYELTLRRIIHAGLQVNTSSVRNLMNLSNYIIVAIKAKTDFLVEQQKMCVVEFARRSNMADYLLRYDKAQQSLESAMSGLAVAASRRAERIIQTILILFTSLTAYSVLNDIVNYIADLNKPITLAWSLRTELIVGMTVVVVVICLIAITTLIRRR